MAGKTKKKSKEKEIELEKQWTNINGDITIWGKEFKSKKKKGDTYILYSTSLGCKNDDDEWDNVYIPVQFKKDMNPGIEGRVDLTNIEGFLCADIFNDEPILKLVITSYEEDI